VLYLSQSPRDEPNPLDQQKNEEDLSFHRHHRRHHHHRHHKDKDGDHKDGEQKKEHNEIPDIYSKSKHDDPNKPDVQPSSNVNNNINESGDKEKGLFGSEEKKEIGEIENKEEKWKSDEEKNRELLNPSSSSSAPASQHLDNSSDINNVKGDHKDGGSLNQSQQNPSEKKDSEFNIENLTVF
jgi:hypothetical protein